MKAKTNERKLIDVCIACYAAHGTTEYCMTDHWCPVVQIINFRNKSE